MTRGTYLVAVVASVLSLTTASGLASAQSNNQKNGDRNIYVTMAAGEDVTIQRFGPLELFAKCSSLSNSITTVEILFTSTEDGWFTDFNGPLAAGEEKRICGIGGPSSSYANCPDGDSAVSPSGHYIGVDGDVIGLGLNIFGNDCLITGQVVTVRD
jgi:hypothetical protein